MKNSKEYTKKVQKLYRSLKREHPKVQQAVYDEPTDAIVYAILSENMSETAAQSAIKKFADYFVDLNDLRVSRVEEIIDVLGGDTPVNRQIAAMFNKILMAVFNEYHTISLMALKKMGKRPAKQILEKLDGTSVFVVNYCMLTALEGHAIPLTTKTIEFLKSNGLVDPDADQQDIEGFLTRQISAKNGYEFYALLRHKSELHVTAKRRRTKKKATPKTKSKRKK
jgi:endonuclease III